MYDCGNSPMGNGFFLIEWLTVETLVAVFATVRSAGEGVRRPK